MCITKDQAEIMSFVKNEEELTKRGRKEGRGDDDQWTREGGREAAKA